MAALDPYAFMSEVPQELGSALFVSAAVTAALIDQKAVQAGPLLEYLLRVGAALPAEHRDTLPARSLALMIQLLEDSAYPKAG